MSGYLLEDGSGVLLLEDGSGIYLLESDAPPTPSSDVRFYEAPPWRFAVTDLESRTLTFLDKIATGRAVTRTLNKPLAIVGTVPSDSPEVNIEHTDGLSFLAEGVRLLYGFRREAPTSGAPWVNRANGILLKVRDRAGATVPQTDYEAYDSWQYLYRRPVVNSSGDIPGAAGISYSATTGDSIAIDLLTNTILFHGQVFLDFPGGPFYTGTVETTDVIDEIGFAAGSTVGEAWDALVQTGTLDIVIDPIYDPINRPGMIGQVSIYAAAGAPRYNAVFAWDRPGASAVSIDHEIDGLERANRVQFFAGQGGPPVAEEQDPTSIALYGEYWLTQFFPKQTKAAAVLQMELRALQLRTHGLDTYQIDPAAERSPIPFVEYDIGDTVKVAGSTRMRQPVNAMVRVESIPLQIADDQLESVNGLLVSVPEVIGT